LLRFVGAATRPPVPAPITTPARRVVRGMVWRGEGCRRLKPRLFGLRPQNPPARGSPVAGVCPLVERLHAYMEKRYPHTEAPWNKGVRLLILRMVGERRSPLRAVARNDAACHVVMLGEFMLPLSHYGKGVAR